MKVLMKNSKKLVSFAPNQTRFMKKSFALVFILLLISSCRMQKDVLYFQNIDQIINETPETYEDPDIQTGDALTITVSAFNAELAAPFNLQTGRNTSISTSFSAKSPSVYVVSQNGEIEMPMLGSIKVTGKTRQELGAFLEDKISEYLENPIVNVRFVNYRVTLLGEFNRPGVVNSDTEKLSIIEAIAKAGDMNLYAIRDSVMLIRTVDDVRTHTFVNLKDANTFNTEYFYLKQNDIVYAMPNKSKALEINTRPLTAALTILGFATAIIALFK